MTDDVQPSTDPVAAMATYEAMVEACREPTPRPAWESAVDAMELYAAVMNNDTERLRHLEAVGRARLRQVLRVVR